MFIASVQFKFKRLISLFLCLSFSIFVWVCRGIFIVETFCRVFWLEIFFIGKSTTWSMSNRLFLHSGKAKLSCRRRLTERFLFLLSFCFVRCWNETNLLFRKFQRRISIRFLFLFYHFTMEKSVLNFSNELVRSSEFMHIQTGKHNSGENSPSKSNESSDGVKNKQHRNEEIALYLKFILFHMQWMLRSVCAKLFFVAFIFIPIRLTFFFSFLCLTVADN